MTLRILQKFYCYPKNLMDLIRNKCTTVSLKGKTDVTTHRTGCNNQCLKHDAILDAIPKMFTHAQTSVHSQVHSGRMLTQQKILTLSEYCSTGQIG